MRHPADARTHAPERGQRGERVVCEPSFAEPDALDHLDLFLALEVDKPQRAALRPIAQLQPAAAADIDAAGPAIFLDPCGGVDRIAPDIELELPLAHDAGRDRPVVDADAHRPIGAT